MERVYIYTDGSSLGNPGPSGWCALVRHNDRYKQISGSEKLSTNGRMELKAVVEGLRLLIVPCQINIFTDSKYVCDSINIYLSKWIKNNFKNVKHPDLWLEYIDLARNHTIIVEWIKAHSGVPQNEHCDKVAKENAKTIMLNEV